MNISRKRCSRKDCSHKGYSHNNCSRKRCSRKIRKYKVNTLYFSKKSNTHLQKAGDLKFIFCLLGNGLGNQLFKYANALIVKNILNIPLLLFNNDDNPHSSVDYRPFLKKGEPKNKTDFQKRIDNAELLPDIIDYDVKPYLAKISEYKMKDVIFNNEYNHIYTLVKDVIPIIKTDFINELKLKYPIFEASILNGVTKENIMFMHVRKGDFNTLEWSSPPEFFISALNIIDTIPEIKIIYILSNNIEYCKEQIKSKLWKSTKELKIFDESDELKCMYLMSLCNGGGILSASTFSWWGAMFGANDNPKSAILHPYQTDTILTCPDQVGNKWRALAIL